MTAALRQALREAIGSQGMRGKVQSADVIDGRVVLQVTIAEGDVRDGVELLLPYGHTALPSAGADVLLTPVLGTRDHLVAHHADATAARIAGLAEGDVGLSPDGLRVIVFRNGRLEIIDVGETLRQLVTDAFVALFNAHQHSGCGGSSLSGPPTVPMTSAHLTGMLHAGGQS